MSHGFALGFGQFSKFRELVEFVSSMLAYNYNLPSPHTKKKS